MKDIKPLRLSIIINFIIVAWATIVTILCVKFDRKHDRLTNEIKTLQDSIRNCNSTIAQLRYDKLVLEEDTAMLGRRIRGISE